MNIQFIQDIFEVCVIPLLGVITAYIIKYVNKKAAEIDDEKVKKYTDMLADIITECVLETSQVYVDSLKKQGKFDKEAQAEAFKQTYLKVMTILSEDAKQVLSVVYGDLYSYISASIEATVRESKAVA